MTAKEFYEQVKKMREAQRVYFKTRNKDHLEIAKLHETRVDQEIKRVEKIEHDKINPRLL